MKYTDEELKRILAVDADTLRRFHDIRSATIKEAEKLVARKDKINVLGISGSARDKLDMAQEDSNSGELLKRCLKNCEGLGAETEFIRLRDYKINYCKACYSTVNTQCHFYCTCYPRGSAQADDMSEVLYDKVLAADVIIFATPVNNFKISTLMTAFIDRCISLDGSLPPADIRAPKNREINIKHMKYIELTADNDIPGSGMLRRFAGKIAGIIVTGHEAGAAMAISTLFMTLNHYGMLFPPFSNMYAMSSICDPTYKDKEKVLDECYNDELSSLAWNLVAAAKQRAGRDAAFWKNDYRSN
jgi:multimeric flavodoxin WrbA